MESRSEVEHDFLGMHSNLSDSIRASQPGLERRQSFRGISKMNPEIVRKVMVWASKPDHAFQSNLPLYQLRDGSQQKGEDEEKETVAPLTIFYKGTVTVVDLPQDKADSVFKFVAGQSSSSSINDPLPSFNPQPLNMLDTLNVNDGDLPIKRNKSLQRFFEKRKERLISVSPFHVGNVSQLHHKSFA
ncbi:hypothetical protein RND81_02G249900 [Saponaria officinalis]|uniref:Protein TIFY n=1 Tax=Saponaria officinalis TaxID=3572 RepID=A0AAW1MNZ7_SAPOF